MFKGKSARGLIKDFLAVSLLCAFRRCLALRPHTSTLLENATQSARLAHSQTKVVNTAAFLSAVLECRIVVNVACEARRYRTNLLPIAGRISLLA
jgi:hypothetical protein